jgi:predicted RNA binding protein YcfA (HicA-like mRNA interferase family)
VSTFERLVKKLVNKPDKISINDVRRLLDYLGFKERKKPGSECVFHKKGKYPITVPTVKGKYVKSFYVKRMLRILEMEEYLENFKGD